MQVRSGLLRGGIALTAAAIAALVAAPIATAANSAEDGVASGHVIKGAGTKGFSVHFTSGEQYDAELFGMKLTDGTMLKMYCVQLTKDLSYTREMDERAWDKYPDPSVPFAKNAAKINWVLHYGYPTTSTSGLESALTKQGVKVHDGISQDEAITATQAAVWHFSDGKDLDRTKPLPYEDADATADVLALYDYLTGDGNTGIGAQPKPTLNISPAKADGKTGTKIGPFTVSTTGDVTALTSKLPEGVKVVDADGKEIKAADVKNGTKLYVDVPADAKDGNGSFSLTANGDLAIGRLFVAKDYTADNPAQSVIVAGSEKTEITAQAVANWAAAPATPTSSTPAPAGSGGGGGLANTGVSAAVPATLGGLLLAAGALMLFLVRRRRSA